MEVYAFAGNLKTGKNYIAEKYNTSAKKIREWNKMKPGSYAIYPGQKLVLFTE